jgi:hypothetical protein
VRRVISAITINHKPHTVRDLLLGRSLLWGETPPALDTLIDGVDEDIQKLPTSQVPPRRLSSLSDIIR